MTERDFLIGVVLAIVTTSETMLLLGQRDRRAAGLPTVARWRVLFGVAVIVAGLVGALWVAGYMEPRP